MAETFNLKDYTRAHDTLPDVLWRVTHPKSQHEVHPAAGDMWARDLRLISDEASLAQAAKNHFSWYCYEPSCFLSVFTNEDHARNWARVVGGRQKSDEEIYITRIITAMLPTDILVFDATDLSNKLGIEHEYSEDEVIFLHRVPWQSLGRTRKLGIHVNGTPKDDSLSPLVHSVQDFNDSVAPLISDCDAAAAASYMWPPSLLHSNPKKVFSSTYQAGMRDMVMAMGHVLLAKLGHGRNTESTISDPFVEISRLLCASREEEEALLLKFAECTSPNAPSPSSQLKRSAEIRRERELQKMERSLKSREACAAETSAACPAGVELKTPPVPRWKLVNISPRVRSVDRDSSKDCTPRAREAANAPIHQSVEEPKAEESGESEAATDVSRDTDIIIPDISALTLQD
jgi:hypothetical protein